MAGERGAVRSGNRVFLSGFASLETPAERALDRIVRSGHPASVLRLHLSRLRPGSLRPYHGQVARCLFDDAVQHGGGQVFACRNGDLVLIAGAEPVASLGAVLMRLFRAETPGDRQLLGMWTLPADEAAVRAEFAASNDDAVARLDDHPAPLGAIAAISTLLASTAHNGFVRRQTAIRITSSRITAVFQKLSVSFPAIEAQIGMPLSPNADPYLHRYIAAQLDTWILASLAGPSLSTAPALNLNLPLSSVGTMAFGAVRDAARRAGLLLGVEIAVADALADLPLFQATSAQLRRDGCTVLLDGIDHQMLLHCDPAALQPDMIKLEWSPLLATLPGREQRRVRQAIDTLGPERVLISRAETEAAMVWGLGQGIVYFQGRHVDLMLAADRLRVCAYSAGCTLRQCIDRAAASDGEGRQGCLDLGLLDGRLHWPASALARPAA